MPTCAPTRRPRLGATIEFMLRWRDFLDRFRPAGAPGAAGPHGVPADRAAESDTELTPVLRRLDAVQDQADRVRAEAVDRAAQVRSDGSAEADAIVEAARAAAESVAVDAMTTVLAAATATGEDDRAALAALDARARERLPEYVRRVTDRAWTDLDSWCGTDPRTVS